MSKFASNLIGRFSELVQLFILVLLAAVMGWVGFVLADGGRPEGYICLVLAAGALIQLPKRLFNLYRDLTGNY
jgi:hypothetical protein